MASPIPDHAERRRWIAETRRREREQVEAAMRRFEGQASVRISDLNELNDAEFDLLLTLLDETLTMPAAPDGSRRTKTRDGRLLVTLTPPPDGQTVRLLTPRGRLLCLDYALSVEHSARHPAVPAPAQEVAG